MLGVDAVLMASSIEERQCSACGRKWLWWASLVQFRGNVQGRGSGAFS